MDPVVIQGGADSSQPPETNQENADNSNPEELVWSAPEFVEHDKSGGWYGALALVAIVAAGLTYLLTKDVISTVVVILALVCLGAYGARKPRELTYHLDYSGLDIGSRHRGLEEFKSFSLAPEANALSIVFMPLKRFAPLTTIYYMPKDEDKIITILSASLPMEEHKRDMVEALMNKIHF